MLRRKFLFLFSFLLVFAAAGCSNLLLQKTEDTNTQEILNKAKNSKLIVLDVYHDRCKSCKLIEPLVKKLHVEYSQNTDIVFLRYDLSNLFTILKSKQLARELGLEGIYQSQKYSGVVLFIDNKNKQILDMLTDEYNITKYIEIIKKRLDKK